MLKNIFSSKTALLYIIPVAMMFSFSAWGSLLNNYAVEVIHFDGEKMGFLQSIREIPGFLAFSVIIVLGFIPQQRLLYLSMITLGFGMILGGQLQSVAGLYISTIVMSVGFHYLETINQSLSLQWLPKATAPITLGKISAVRSITSLVVFALIFFVMKYLHLSYEVTFAFFGIGTILIGIISWIGFSNFKEDVVQKKSLKLKKEYWLFYLLTFLAGARRQIFTIFATFLLVEKFGLKVEDMAVLLFVNAALNMYLAPKIGHFIVRFGERFTMQLEYFGLVLVFTSYAFVESIYVAFFLYICDHLLFAMSFARKTYFQKIANPEDISSANAVSFTINHISAVFLPALLGMLWLYSNALVFIAGSCIGILSFLLSFLIPKHPKRGCETIFKNERLSNISNMQQLNPKGQR